MTNTAKLNDWINARGFKMSFISDHLGISRECMRQKANNLREFKASEIAAFMDLGMSKRERDEIFFAKM